MGSIVTGPKKYYYIMDTDYQDLATATEVLNKAYQLKQVNQKCKK